MEQFQQLKNAKYGYYLVKWTSDSYNLHSSRKIVTYVIKPGELVCDSVYLNQFDHFKESYPPYG